MRTIEVNLYEYDELSDSAKERARDWYRHGMEYAWLDEWIDSARAFAEATGTTLKDYSIGLCSHSYFHIAEVTTIPWFVDGQNELTGLRLRTWIINNVLPNLVKGKYYGKGYRGENGKYVHKFRHSKIQMEYDNCPLTGFCGDQDFIQPLLDFVNCPDSGWNGTRKNCTYNDLLNECFDEGLAGIINDLEHQESDEYIEEQIQANEYEFTEEGERA